MAEERKCPGCGESVEADVVICVKCGMNLKTGLHATATTTAPVADEGEVEEEEAEEPLTPREKVGFFLGENFPGLFNPRLLVVSFVLVTCGMVALYITFGFFLRQLFLGPMFIGALGIAALVQGVGMLMMGYFCLLHDALIEFDGKKWSVFFITVFVSVTAMFLLAKAFTDPGRARRGVRAPRVRPVDSTLAVRTTSDRIEAMSRGRSGRGV